MTEVVRLKEGREGMTAGAAIVAITFLVSLVVLLMDGNMPVSIATIIATLLLGMIMKQSWSDTIAES